MAILPSTESLKGPFNPSLIKFTPPASSLCDDVNGVDHGIVVPIPTLNVFVLRPLIILNAELLPSTWNVDAGFVTPTPIDPNPVIETEVFANPTWNLALGFTLPIPTSPSEVTLRD